MAEEKITRSLRWAASVIGPCEPVEKDTRFHGRSGVWRLAQDPVAFARLANLLQ
jgi:hypothetical protein